ncbi:MAG: YihY/virulence factor BrkB family protein [Geobacteraceae bacterium]
MNHAPKRSRTNHFFTTIWELEPGAYRGLRRTALRYLQITTLVLKKFLEDRCLLHASALTFSTLLSIVPFFALAFALLKGFGVQSRLEPLILEQVAARSQEIVTRIVAYINNTNMASLGVMGLIALIITVITLLDNIEDSFNVIWGVRETRSFYQKFSNYLSVLVSAPILMVAATGVTTSLQSQTIVQWLIRDTYLGDALLLGFRCIPYLSVWLALVFVYIFIPNIQVRFKSALIGGILAGTLWQIAQWGYIHFQVGVSRYNAIYGALATLPIFMIWIYTGWLIILFGVEVIYAHQNMKTFRSEVQCPIISQRLKELFALALLRNIAYAFHHNLPACSAKRMAEELDAPLRVVQEIITRMEETGYLVAAVGAPTTYLPTRELEQVAIHDVLQSVRNYGGGVELIRLSKGEKYLYAILGRSEASVAAALDGLTLKDLVTNGPLGEAAPEAVLTPSCNQNDD